MNPEIAINATNLRDIYSINTSGMLAKTRKDLLDTGITDEMIEIVEKVYGNKEEKNYRIII